MSLATPHCVQELQTASHGTSCVFSESRVREICLSGSTSGNRKPDQAKPDQAKPECGDEAKAKSTNHRETTVTAPVLDSTPHCAQNPQ
jgi:hypothetical protein